MIRKERLFEMLSRGLAQEHSSKLEILHRIFDAALIVACFFIAAMFYDYPWNPHFSFFAILAVIVFYFSARQGGLYRSWRMSSFKQESVTVLQAWLLTMLVVLVIAFLSKFSGSFFRRVVVFWFVSGFFSLIIFRYLARFALRSFRRKGFNVRSVVIAGAGDLGTNLARVILNNDWMGLRFDGFYDDFKPKGSKAIAEFDITIKGNLDELIEEIKERHVDYVYLALPLRAEKRLKEVIQKLSDTTASVYIVPDIFTFGLLNARMVDMGGIPTISVYENPFYGINDWIKRGEDIIVGSLITLMILPLMVILAVGVKLSSPGPVIFKQRRYGFNGEEIFVWKFRTMSVCEDGPDIPQAQKNDPRITKFGEFLRKTSLDELPQFINVLQGRMSIVGPRPHAVAHNEYYRNLIPGYMLRHKVKPGITGWAQVNGWRGETDTLEKMQKRVDFDLAYIRNWSFWMDIKIIFMTVFGGFGGKNAY